MWKTVIASGYLIILIVGVAFLGTGLTFEEALRELIPESTKAPVTLTTTTLSDSVKRSEGFLGPGDITSFHGEEGWIVKGWIRDGTVTTTVFVLQDDSGETLLIYEQKTIDIGHVEMISFPQRGESGEIKITVDGRNVQDVLGSEW